MSEAIFPDGLRVFKPNDNAPDFVKANIEIDKPALLAWLSKQRDKINLQVKQSKKGTYYAQVNDYQPKGMANAGPGEINEGVNPADDLPF